MTPPPSMSREALPVMSLLVALMASPGLARAQAPKPWGRPDSTSSSIRLRTRWVVASLSQVTV